MSDHTRRRFLALAGAGAAAVSIAAAEPADAKTAQPGQATQPKAPAGASGPLVAYVSDVKSGAVVSDDEDQGLVIHLQLLETFKNHRGDLQDSRSLALQGLSGWWCLLLILQVFVHHQLEVNPVEVVELEGIGILDNPR